MDNLIGKTAYKKTGFFAYRFGVIEKSNSGITPYILNFGGTKGSVGFHFEKDIVLVKEDSKI